MSRWKAAGLHLLISLAVALAALVLTLGVMYPWTYFRASGANTLLTILLTVDVVIGPLLTLIVFKSGKPSLKFDLTVIALLQLAALVYGFFVVIEARPVFLVHVGDRFHLVRANELEAEQLAKGREERFRTLSWTGPRLAVALKPANADRQQELLMMALSGADLNQFPESYADYDNNRQFVLARARPLKQLMDRGEEEARIVERALQQAQRKAAEVRFVPLAVGDRFLTALIDAKSAELLQVIALDPWE